MKSLKKLFISSSAALCALALTGCNGGGNDGKVYTMHDFLASTTSLQWNPLTWETADDSAMLAYLSMGFYDYRVDVDAQGKSKGTYIVVPEMAAELPTDVTASYAGKLGVKEGEKNKAFRIKLNQAAKWQDGTKITADDYIYSMQQQLDPAQMNRRADSYYGGDFSFYNAQNYLYQGKKVEQDAKGEVALADLTKGADGVYGTAVGPAYVAVNAPLAWTGGNTLKDYVDAYGAQYFGMDHWEDLVGKANDAGLAPLTDETYAWLKDVTTTVAAWGETEADCPNYFYITNEYGAVDFKDVGLQKIDDYTIDIIIEKELENPTFYLPYYLSSTWLVQKDLYEKSWTTTPDGKKVNNYGKKLENTISYGPYKLTSYEEDKQLLFARNDNWYGWTDEAHVVNGKRLYQTTNIQIDVVAKHETALLSFKQGKLDGVGLQSADMEEFGNSKYKMLTPQSYTTKLSFNTDKAALEARETAGVNKVALTNQKFRHAISLSFDRADFCSKLTAGHSAGFGMFNYLYQYFNSQGLTSSYRDSDAAKDALCRVYGVEYGPDKEYKTLEEAYKSITGYDQTAAKALLVEAIDEMLADGTWNGTDKISLQFTVYQNDEIYTQMFNFFDSAVKEIAKGTQLEGKVEFTMNVDDDYYNTMYAGKTDIIFTTWGGAQYGVFGILSNCYVDDYTGGGNQMEVGFDTSKVAVAFTLNETVGEKTYSLKAWADWLNAKANTTGEDIDTVLGSASSYRPETRVELLAELEYNYLNSFVTTPVYYRQTVTLRSMKINYPSDEYIDLVGFGGLSQITYNYTDAEWDAFVASQGGTLKY